MAKLPHLSKKKREKEKGLESYSSLQCHTSSDKKALTRPHPLKDLLIFQQHLTFGPLRTFFQNSDHPIILF